MRIIVLIFLAFPALVQAQTKVYIESSQSFLMGNASGIFSDKESKSVRITLDARGEIWLLPKGGPMLKREISPQGSTMTYELLRNAQGKWVLRFRGSEAPTGFEEISTTTKQPWPAAVLAVVDVPKTEAIPAEDETIDPAQLKEEMTEEPAPEAEEEIVVPGAQIATTQQMLDRINAAAYEFEKLQLALEYVKNGTTVEEVIELGKLLQYETSRLEFFITAYPFCKNRQAYHMVEDYLEYNASKQRLRESMKPQ